MKNNILVALGAFLLSAILPVSVAAQDLPKDVAEHVVHHYLATRLVEMCNDYSVDEIKSKATLRELLAKHDGMTVSNSPYERLRAQLGEAILVGAEQVYFEQMNVSVFRRPTACSAIKRAQEDKQDIGALFKRRAN